MVIYDNGYRDLDRLAAGAPGAAPGSAMSRPIDCSTLERICDALTGLEDGEVVIAIHNGEIVQVSRTEKLRPPTTAPRWNEAR